MQKQLKIGLLLLSVAAVSACGGGPDPEPAEVFRLTEVGGQSLPVSYPEEQGCTEEVLGATLALEADGEWEMRMDKREICGDAVSEDEDVEEGTYTREGQTLRFTSPQTTGAAPGEIEIENLAEGTLQEDVLAARLTDDRDVPPVTAARVGGPSRRVSWRAVVEGRLRPPAVQPSTKEGP